MDDFNLRCCGFASDQEDGDVRKGPWTVEEDAILSDYVTIHGEGRWNTAARCAGLKRTGKSCRLRWLNYLRPNVRRGNITLQEQLLILELHSRWGNRWSKIAQYLPGRTDNEIKNYWRTRVQKQAKHLNYEVNSKQFRDAMRYIWMPRLIEQIQATSGSSTVQPTPIDNHGSTQPSQLVQINDTNIVLEPSVTSSDSFDPQVSPVSDVTDSQITTSNGYYCQEPESVQNGSGLNPGNESDWWGWSKVEVETVSGGELMEDMWNEENIWFLRQQLM